MTSLCGNDFLYETSAVTSKASSAVTGFLLGRQHWEFFRHLAVFLVIQQKQQLLDVAFLQERYKVGFLDVFDIGLDLTSWISHQLGIHLLLIIVL